MERLISTVICISLFLSSAFSASAKAKTKGDTVDDEKVVLNESFDDCQTGSEWSTVNISGAQTRIVEMQSRNKAVLIIPAKSPAIIRKSGVSFENDFIISFDLPTIDKNLNLSVGISAENKRITELVKVKDNNLFTYDNIKIKNFLSGSGSAKILLRVHKTKYFDVYVNDTCILSGKKMPAITFSAGDVVFYRQQAEGELLLDNVKIYYSDNINAQLTKKEYNPDAKDVVNAQNDNGDYLYFDSTNIDNSTGKYVNYVETAGNNIIKCERFDYKNPDRQHNWIYMEKKSFDDCFITITMKRGASARDNTRKASTRQYTYYLYETDFKIDEFSRQISLPQIRDSVSNKTEVSQSPMIVGDGGSIQFSDGSIASGIIQKGKWHNMKLYFDYIADTVEIYIDSKKIKTLDIVQGMRFPEKFRVLITSLSDKGKIYLDNMKFTGLVNPYKDMKEDRVDIFTDEAAEREFLKGKIGFNVNSSIMYANDQKYVLDKAPVFDGDELYADIDSFNTAFNTKLKSGSDGNIYSGETPVPLKNKAKNIDGTVYVPVKELGKDFCKKELFYHDKTGVILFDDKPIKLDVSDWDYKSVIEIDKFTVLNDLDFINNILTFERPDKEKLREDAVKRMGNLNVHPRLVINRERVEYIKNIVQTDETAKKLFEKILSFADKSLETEVITYKYADDLRTKQYADAGIVDLMYRGMAWLVTGDKKYLDKQWLDLESIANFPDYNVATIHDSAQWNAILALGYDWFYDGLTQKQRDFIANKILTHSLPPLADGYYGRLRGRNNSGDWANFKWVSNIASVSNAGALLAAAAVAEYAPEYCFDVIEKAIMGLEHPLMYFAPNGAWNEGSGYWGYTCQYLGYSMLTLRSMFGSFYGLDDAKGFKNTDNAMLAITGPCGVNNVGDASGGESTKSFQAYNMIGEIIGSPKFQEVRVSHVLGDGHIYAEDLFSYVKYDNKDEESSAAHHQTLSGSEFFTIRQDYSPNSTGLFFSTHFGPTSGYHTHNDTGTFVLDMLGERWATDFGPDEYSLQNFLGYKASDLYRYRAEGHNCLVINPSSGFEQQQGKFVPLERYDSNEYGGYVITDMSDVYEDADKVKMGYYIDDNMRSVTAAYEIKLKKESELYWFMHTNAEVIADGNNAYLVKNGKRMALSFETNASDATLSVMKAEPLETSPKAPQQNQNVGYRKVAVKIKANGEVNFKIKIAPMGEGISMKATDTPIDLWQLPEKKQIKENTHTDDVDVKIMCDGMELTGDKALVYDSMPKVWAELSDPTFTAEIKEAKTIDEQTVIKIYDKDKNLVRVNAISYYKAGELDAGEARIRNVEVSSEPQPQNGKINMLDGNFQTRWTGMALGEYAVFDLGEVVALDKVSVAFWKQAERRYYFDILISEDGTNYKNMYSGESAKLSSDNEYTNIDLSGEKARYVKIVGNGNSVSGPSNININVLEFKVYKK